MPEESTTVNSLVENHAAKLLEKESGPNQESTTVTDPPPAGGTETKTDPPAELPKPDYTDLFKELGVDNIDSLKEKLKPKTEEKVLSPEEKAKQEGIYKASVQKYAVENGVMNLEDFTKLENLKTRDDKDLVFENWLPAWKEDNPDIDAAEADRLAKEEFEAEYKLSSTNEKAKARGLSKIQKEAEGLRNPLENKFKSVKENYDGVRDVETNFPEFNKKVTGFIKEHVPEKVTVFKVKDGEEEVPIEVELSAADRVEILNIVGKKILANEGNYNLYKKGDMKALQELAKSEAETLIATRYRDTAAQKIAESFLSRGVKKGSTTGATVPFPLNDDGKTEATDGNRSAKQIVMDGLHGKK